MSEHVKDGERYKLVLQHGTYTKENVAALRQEAHFTDEVPAIQPGDPVTEEITGTVRVFKQDGTTHYEAITTEVEAETNVDGKLIPVYRKVGFRPEHVLKATKA